MIKCAILLSQCTEKQIIQVHTVQTASQWIWRFVCQVGIGVIDGLDKIRMLLQRCNQAPDTT